MKKQFKKFRQLFSYIVNPKKQRIITHDVHANYVILLIIAFGILSGISNHLIGLDETTYISIAITIIAIVYLFLNMFTNRFKLLATSGFIILLLGYNAYYIYNNGSEGPMIYFSFLFVYFTLLYSNKTIKYILFFLYLANILLLYYLEFKMPGIFDEYENFDAQFFDHMVSMIIVTFAFIVLIRNLINVQLNEKEIAQESNRLKSTFLANTSHDLRAPVNSILSFSELINQEKLSNSEIGKYVKIIHSNSAQLLTLINDIFDISIIESNNIIINPQNININDALEEIYANAKRDIEISKKQIDLDVIFGLPLTQSVVYIDQVRIKQILTNLIQNAIKHTESGMIVFGYDKKIDTNELLFFVKDTGYGIPEDKLEDIFKRYVTGIDKTKTIKGTGLGLHITSSLVKLMKGEIWVESKVDIGSKFFFTIPIEKQPIREKSKI